MVPAETPPLPDRTLVGGIAAIGLATAALGVVVRSRSARQRSAAADQVRRKHKQRERGFRVRRLSFTGLLTRLFRPSGMTRAARERGKHAARRT